MELAIYIFCNTVAIAVFRVSIYHVPSIQLGVKPNIQLGVKPNI